jgi:hypothetical protein
MLARDERFEPTEPTVIPSIMAMADEAAVAEPAAEPQPAAPSLTEAYNSEHAGIEIGKPKKREEGSRNATLAEEKDTARALSEAERKAPRRREQTLSEAHDGIVPEEETDPFLGADNIPEILQRFDQDAITAAMMRLGLEESDLQDVRWQNALADILEREAEADPDATEEEEGAESEETEEAEQTEEVKPEEKKVELPMPKTVAEYIGNDPEREKTLNQHVEGVWNRAQETNSPVMVDLFTQGLAKTLGTSPENLPVLRETVEILSAAGYGLVETAIPRLLPQLMNEYMAQNFGPILEHYAPGLGDSFREATASNIWGETLDSEEFSGKGLPEFGTPEFQEAAKSVHEKNPWLNDFDPKGPDGRPLPALQALRIRAAVTARLLVGEKVDSKKQAQLVADAMAKGKQSAESANRRVSAGRALRAGKTTGTMGRETSERESLIDAFKRGGGGGAI